MAGVGEKMFRLAGDPSIMSIDDLGQALFNREGDCTSSKYSISLAWENHKVEGFADYRYNALWANEIEPNDSLAVGDSTSQPAVKHHSTSSQPAVNHQPTTSQPAVNHHQ